nr:Ig-like domain-containing protein [Budvicia aquatica]
MDAGLPGLRINTVAGDDIINAIELGQPLVITGTSTGLAVGSVVTVTINGKDYVASVTADGSWSLGVSANEVAAFPAGNLVITANANDEGGNPAINVHNVTVDLAVVAISINTVAGDNILRAEEREQDLLLTGSTQNVEQGQTVTVNVGGKAHLATVDSDGNWAITVSPADLNGLKDGINNISVSVNNAAGNGASAAQEVRVDTVAPTINIDTVAGDNILNAVEAGQPLTISGTTVGAEAGQVVTVSLGGKNYSATVDADGRWTLDIPAENLASLPIGNIEVIASVSDKAGNGGTTSHHLLVDVTAPTMTIHTVAGDDVINATEHAQAQIISGTTIDAVAGDQVSVTIGSKTYHTVVNADGNWSVGVPANVISALQNGTVTITATVTDKAGNSSSTEHDVLVNTAAPTLLIGTLAGDDIINATEKGQSLTINGTSTHVGEGLTVTVTLNGKNYTTQVDSAGHWTLDVPAADVAKLGEANYTVSASVTDNVGNSVVSTHDVKVNTAAPQVMINAVGGDDILNAAEVGVEQTISGRVINVEAGQTVTISLGGNTYTTTVNSGGTWSVNVPSADLKALGDGQLNITAGVTNKAGNEGFGERDIAISAGLPGLRIDTVAGDDIINAIELGQSLVITGNSVGLNAGSTVNVTINGKGYSASVNADGSWSVGVPVVDVGQFPAGTLVIAASGTDTSSNTVQVKHNVTVDLNTVAISIDSVADDNVISALEKGQDLLLTGQTQNVEAGQTVTVNIGGKTYDVNVNANGSWSVNVPAADLNGLKEGMNNVSVSVKNAAGNSASAAQDVRVDTSSPTVTINTIASDDILNAAEAGQPLTISGMVIGAEAGQTVTVSLGGKNYTTTVKADGSWLLDVAANNVGALTNGNVIVTAKVADKAGNEGSSSHNLLVDTSAPGITIATVAGDNIINATEHAQEQVIRGSTTNAVVGDKIVVTIDGHSYNTTVNADGSWSVGVPVSVISALQDGSATITATVTDKAGNSSSVSQDILVSTASPTLNINVIAGDNIINATEKGQDLTISGTSQNVAAGLTVTVTLNGKTYTALVAGDGGWTLNVPANDVAALGEANYIVNASVTDSVGNAVNANHNVVVNTGLPGITIDTVAGDNVINATEIQSAQTISGKVYNVEVGQTVTVTINGETYQATVQTGGKWSVSVAADDWQAIGNGNIVVTAEVTNHAGNSGQGTHNVVIDANLPGIRIGAISGDDVINIIEHGQDLIIKGSSEGFNVGAILKVTVNGITYDATVGKDGNWLVDVSAIDVSNFPAGTLTVTAQGQNAIGESVSNSHLVQVDLASTAITINTVAGDDIINAAEKGQAVTLGGSVVGIEVGQLVTLVIGGMTYTTTVLSGGNWTYTLSANAVSKLAEGNLDITVNVENQSGNSASAGRQVVVNSQVPAININTISGDDMINSAEHTQSLTINGTSYGLESGREVTVTINGLNYTTLVAKDGSWTLDVPANIVSGLAYGSYQITASASNVAGNSSSANHSVIVDTMAPTVAIDNVTSDNMLNAEEHANNQVISGTSNAIGQMIYVTIGGETYSTEVRKDGTWIVGVPSTVINGLNEGTNTVEVSVADKAGNVVTSSKDFEVIAGVPTLSINAISGDNVINQLEHGGNLEISGTASTSLIGREVTVTLNGKNYTATVDGTGAWTLTIDAAEVGDLSGSYYKVTASATDISGNSANGARDLALDLVPPSLTVSDIAIDNVVNAIEHGNSVTIKGSYGGAENGQLVTVTLNGKDYSVAVTGNGSWSITVPASDVQNLIDGDYNVKVSLSDKAGNKVSVDKPLVVDTTAPEISINAVTGDDSISVTEQAAGVTINGTTTAEVGQTVSVNFNGRNYSATVTAENTWTINVPSNHFNGIVDGTYPVTVTVSDNAGNNSTLSHNVTVVTKLPSLTIDTFAGDNVVNGDEHQQSQVISGTSDAIGQFVTVTLNGKTYSNIQVENNGTWRVTVSATDMLALNEGLTKIVASVSSATGNGYSTESTIEVDLTPPAAQVVINSITNDTGVSSSDYITSDTKFVINGSINGSLAAGEYAEISLDNGATWKKLTLINGLWTLNNGTTDWAEGEHTYYMRVVDAAGNVGVVTNHKVTVDTTAPDQVISVSHITDDTGTYDNDFVTYDTTPSLFGALSRELGSDETLQIRLDSGIWVTVANVTGKDWQFDTATALTEGSHTYELRVIDLAGNTSSVVSKDITVDVTPSTISTTIVSFTDNVGTNQSNYPSGTETDDTLPTLNGTLIGKLGSGDVVRIYVDGVWAGNATVSGTTWTYDIKTALSEGQHTFTAVVTDLAGNEGTPSPEFSLVIDTIAPTETATIVSYTDDVGLYQGNFGSGTYTDDTNVVLNGTLSGAIKATDVVRVYEGNTLLGTATVNGTDWTFNLNGLSEGTHTYHVVVSDVAGNESPASNNFVMNVDITAPTSVITVDTKLTADTTPTITGTVTNLGADERLWINVNGVIYREGIDNALSINRITNTWALVIDNAHALNADGVLNQVYNVDARITDKAGNFSEVSSKDQLTVYSDTAIIRSPSFDYMAETQPAFIIKGTAGTGETMIVEVRNAGGTLIKTFSSADGSLVKTADGSYTIASSAWGTTKLVSGEYSINSYVNVADGSGGQASTTEYFTVIEPNTAQNVTNANDDSASRVYATSDGGYWMFWASGTTATGNTYNLYAQRYDQSGNKVGSQVTISNDSGQNNANNLQYIRLYDVYMKEDNSFSVFYSSGAAQIPYLQNFDVNGAAVGARVSITNTLAFELTPTYVSMADGGYALVFNSGTISNYNVYAIRYDANGTALDARPVALTTGTNYNNGFAYVLGGYVGQPTGTGTSTATTTQGMSAVDIGDSKYAVLYMSSKPGSVGGTDMYMKVIDFKTGNEVSGSEIMANAFTDKMQIGASMVALKGGGFIAAWASNTGSAGNNYGTMDGFDVYARRFTWDVATQKLVALDATEVRVNTSTDGVNGVAYNALSVNMDVAALEQGGYVVVWSKFTAANKSDVYAQSFDAAGNKLGGETLISTNNANLDSLPSVTALADGGYVVSWDSMTTTANYLNGYKNDINSVIVNADGTIRGTGDTNSYSPTASYLDGSGTLTGDAAVNTLDGRHGATVMNAGAGNDYIIINNTNFTSIDGGTGFDTLIWNSANNLNFSDISNKVTGIEAIHMGDEYANVLSLTLQDVLNASDTTDVLVVQGGVTDSVNLTDTGWYSVGSQIWRGDTYQVLLNTYDINASLWVQNGVVVKNNATAMLMNPASLSGSEESDVITMDNNHQVINIGNSGHDTLLYKLLNSADATGGNDHSVVNGFTVGSWENTSDTDRIDLSSLLQGSGYNGSATASYVNGIATLGSETGNIEDYINVRVENGNTVISIDRDGAGNSYNSTDLVTISGVQTDLATLLANHQLLVV